MDNTGIDQQYKVQDNIMRGVIFSPRPLAKADTAFQKEVHVTTVFRCQRVHLFIVRFNSHSEFKALITLAALSAATRPSLLLWEPFVKMHLNTGCGMIFCHI
jgi:hypothetical protein